MKHPTTTHLSGLIPPQATCDNSRRHRRSRLVMLIAMPLVALLGFFGLVAGYAVFSEHRAGVEQRLSTEALLASHDVNAFFLRYMTLVDQAASNDTVARFLGSLKPGKPAAANPHHRDVLAFMDNVQKTSQGQFLTTWICDFRSGVSFQSSNAPWESGPDWQADSRPWYARALRNEGLFLNPPYIEAAEGRHVISLVRPITDSATGEVIGVFGADLAPDQLAPLMQSACPLGEDHLVLIAPDGTVVYHPDKRHLFRHISELPYSPELLQAVEQSRDGRYEFTLGGISMRANLSVLTESGWMVLAEQPLQSPFATLPYSAVAVGLCFLMALLFLGGSLFALRTLLRRLEDNEAVLENEVEKRTQSLIRQDAMLWTVNDIAQKLLASSQNQPFDSLIGDCLRLIGQTTWQNRVYIWQDITGEDGCPHCTQVYEWVREVRSIKDDANLHSVPYVELPTFTARLDQGVCLNSLVRDLPASERAVLEPQGILALLIAPIRIDGVRWGFIGVDNCESAKLFSELEENMLLTSGFMLANAILRENTESRLREAEERTQIMLNAMPLCCNFWNRSVQNLACNDEAVRLFELSNQQEYLDRFSELSPRLQPCGRPSAEMALEKIVQAFAEGCSRFEWLHQKLDGTPIPCDITLVRMLFKGEHIVVGYTRDLREIKATMAEVSRVQEALAQARDEAVRHSRAKSDFLARMSHEIRTPMNAIVGMAELILREQLPHKIKEHTLTIRQAGAHLLSIINDILDFSKIESGKLEISCGQYLFASLLNDAINIIRVRMMEKPIVFAVNVDPTLPATLVGDDIRIRQILLNVLNNAVKYTEEGFVTLTVSGEKLDESTLLLRIAVADSGVGIKEEDLANLFGQFVQFDTTRHRGVEGTGLGLAITRSLCRAMDGDIEAASVYGKGSVFTVTLRQGYQGDENLAAVKEPKSQRVLLYEPRAILADSIMNAMKALKVPCTLVENQSALCEALGESEFSTLFMSSVLFESSRQVLEQRGCMDQLVVLTERSEVMANNDLRTVPMPLYAITIANVLNGVVEDLSQMNDASIRFVAPQAQVLVVDDITTNLKVAEGLMAPYGMRIDVCESGAEAVELVRTRTYDLIFMDHMMPGMNGVEATLAIRELPRGKDVPVVALTANAVTGIRDMFLSNGFNDFLAKPIETSRLNSTLERWIPKKKQERHVVLREADVPSFTIDGLNTQRGLSMAGGNMARYMDILSTYCRDGKLRIPELRQAVKVRDYPLYTTYVHALKSASAAVGAENVSELAKKLEEAGRQADDAVILRLTEPFLAEFETLLNCIGQMVSSRHADPSCKTLSEEELTGAFNELQAALSAMDAVTVDRLLNTLRQECQGTPLAERVDHIAEQVLLCEYEEAVGVVETILQA